MNVTIQTIPELLVQTRGNMTEAGRLIDTHRITIAKYARDFNAKHHAIVNGILMIHRGWAGDHKRVKHG